MQSVAWMLFLIVAWYLPGVVVARLFFRETAASVRLAVCWVAAPVAFSVLAVVLGIVGLDPLIACGTIALAGLVGLAVLRPWQFWTSTVRAARWVFLVPVLLGLGSTLMTAERSFTSDTNAHIAAVRRSVEEAAAFPERGFHADPASHGVDPRFGTLHAFNAVACRVAGLEPREAWHAMRGAGLAVSMAGALALLTAVAGSGIAVAAGLVALLATHGGVFYSILSVSAYPLWFSLGIVWTLVGFALRGPAASPTRIGIVSAITLAGLVGIHFFAFMLGGFLLAALVFTAAAERRRTAIPGLFIGAIASAPWVLARLFTSYVNDNPIHQKVWQCMEWAPGLYSASPTFVTGWLFPLGVVALGWGFLRWRELRSDHAFRWLMWSALVAITWITVPWLLTPSMKLIGFLPLRLLMGVGGAFLLALIIDRLGRRRTLVAIAVMLVLAPALGRRAERLLPGTSPDSEHWSALVDALEKTSEARPLVLSDPFTMLALSADAAVDVVAVPDGRSSPRDSLAIARLRDAWWGMSAASGGAATDEVLQGHRVTHVVVNVGLPAGLASYEYPVHTASFLQQLAKFESNPQRFRRLWSSGDLHLYEVAGSGRHPWDESWLKACVIVASTTDGGVGIGDGYEVAATAWVEGEPGARALRIEGELGWSGEGTAPDRQLIVRLDRSPSSVPRSLAGVAKPVRKLRELFGAPRERYRWTTSPGGGRCPTWLAGQAHIEIDLDLSLPEWIAPGDYVVTLAARDRSVFVPVRLRDLLVDHDSWRGPVLSTVRVD